MPPWQIDGREPPLVWWVRYRLFQREQAKAHDVRNREMTKGK